MEENPLTPSEEQQIENELKALDLELNYGAHLHISKDAPPELVSQFLENVKHCEDAYDKLPKVSIHEFIGQPKIKPFDSLGPEELEPEIERLLALLQEKSVITERPKHLSPTHYYRFLSEEFMQHPMSNYSAPGVVHFFDYGEFHHDGPEFIMDHVSEFLLDLLHLDRDFEGLWLSDHCRDDLNAITKAEVMLRCNRFRALHRALKPIAFQAQKAETHNGTMYLFFGIAWEAVPLASEAPEHHKGLGICQLSWEDDEWMIQGVNMPGFSF